MLNSVELDLNNPFFLEGANSPFLLSFQSGRIESPIFFPGGRQALKGFIIPKDADSDTIVDEFGAKVRSFSGAFAEHAREGNQYRVGGSDSTEMWFIGGRDSFSPFLASIIDIINSWRIYRSKGIRRLSN